MEWGEGRGMTLEAISKLVWSASKILRFAQNDIEGPGGKAVTLSAAKGLGFETFETVSGAGGSARRFSGKALVGRRVRVV